MITASLLVLLILLVTFHLYTRYNRKGRLFNNIDGPRPYPIIGSALLYCNIGSPHDFWLKARAMIKEYYPISRVWGIDSAVVNIFHPDDLEVLLSSQRVMRKGYAYWFLQPWLKTGLLTSSGEKWRQRRRLLTPAFHFGILKKYMDIISEQADKFVQGLEKDGHGTIQDLISLCSDCTLKITCEANLGTALDKIDSETVRNYKEAIHDIGQVVIYRLVRPYIMNWMLPYVSKLGNVQTQALKVLHSFTNQMIKERKEYHFNTGGKYLSEHTDEEKDSNYNDLYITVHPKFGDAGCFSNVADLHHRTTKQNYVKVCLGRKKRLAMLDHLIAIEKKGLINEKGLQEEVDTFTFGGHDTTAVGMSFTLMLLAENPKIQERARAEVSEVMDNNDGKIGNAEIQEFNYLERCIKECLRLYPPISTIMRHTSEELQLKHALVPSNTHVIVHFWDTHRDPNFWPDPNKFDPDRFLPDIAKNRHPFAYVPFSAGPRNCIGQKLAMMMLKSLIGRILYDFVLEPVDRTADLRLTADIVLRPLDPVRIRFVKIKK